MKNYIRTLRTARSWSQADFAERLGVSRQTASAIESGKSDPSLPLALRIAWVFGAAVEDVFYADLEEKMAILNATWAYKNRLATAFDEVGVLESMGADHWELVGFGVGFLRFRRPEDESLRVRWDYRRVDGLMASAERAALESGGWTFCGSWMALFHYFKRRSINENYERARP
jgi:putative transcriptional regulator